MTSALTAASFTNLDLGVQAGTTATLYQRTGYNLINSTAQTGLNIGTLTQNESQLSVVGNVTGTNSADYYTFNLQGNALKLAFQNDTNTTGLRVQVYDSTGTNLLADSQGTTAQQTAYSELTSATGLAEQSGQYVVKVSYAPISLKSLSQNYDLELYSGNTFQSAYQTTAVAQTNASTTEPVDNSDTYATSDATLSTRDAYNEINETASGAVNIGWLAANKTQLSLTSQLTTADDADYYSYTFQTGSSIKLAFDNQTATSNLRIQLLDSTGTEVIADNYGTTQQKTNFAALESSDGLKAQNAGYLVKVSYAPGANTSKTQTYNFQLLSGNTYSAVDATTASAQTVGNAILNGNYSSAPTAAEASANYVNNLIDGTSTDAGADIFTTLETYA